MIRPTRIVGLGVLAATLVGLYQMKSAVEVRDKELTQVRRAVAEEKETVQVLRAEWSYLNQPERLTRLARTQGTLKPLSGAQLSSLERAGAKLGIETADASEAVPPDRGKPPR